MASVRSGVWEEQGTTSSVVINKPSGTASGDLLIAAISAEDNATVTCSSRPAGWTRLSGASDGNPEVIDATGADLRLFIYMKTAGGSEPTTYTFGLSASVYTSEAMIAIQSPGSIVSVSGLSESIAAGVTRLDNVTVGTDEVAIGFCQTYLWGSSDAVTNWSEPTGSTRMGFYRTASDATEEVASQDDSRWASVVIVVGAAGAAGTTSVPFRRRNWLTYR